MVDREGRISALPDHLLHHIFSFLELKEIIATSLLSTRWRFLWTSVPTLDLGSWSYRRNHDIPTQISLSLMNYASPKIRKFRAHFDFADIKHWHVYSWIRFAAERDVQEFDLSIVVDSGWNNLEVFSTLTFKVLDCLLKCSSLEVLKLSFCQLNLRSSSCNLCLLRELELCYVSLSDVDTSGCPVLESLILFECNPDEPLNIYAPSPKLRYLQINDIFQLGRVTLFAPNLQSIEFDGYVREAYNVKNLSSLRIASFELIEDPGAEFVRLQPLMELLRGVLHASTLRLNPGFMECLSFLEAGVKLPPFRTTCLELKTALQKSDLKGMALVLSSATSLETLILDTSSIKVYMEGQQHLADLNLDDLWGSLGQSLFSIRSLKNIEIKNFLGSESEWLCKGPGPNFNNLMNMWEKKFNLVKTLLNSCTMLEKMSISPLKISSWPLKPELLLALTKSLLLTFPRASANAEIYFL